MNDKRLDAETRRLIKRLQDIIYTNYLAALNITQVRNSLRGDRPFWFSQNASADKAMNKIIADFNKKANSMILNGIERSWKYGEDNHLDKIQLAVSKSAQQNKALDQVRERAAQQQRNEGSGAASLRFANEKRGGTTLSNRVWNLSGGMKKEIEAIIQNGMIEGKTADQLATMLKKHLNNPDSTFRHVRNKETGELELSEAAKKYKPGQGVYRSAYKNALRLARTEIAAAYRRAAWEKFQTDPTVIGIRIELSNNHTCMNPKTGKPEPFVDICDELAGDYPKTFLWTGWHPQCRCEMYPILVSGKELRKMTDAEFKGETYEPKQITEPPKALGEWIEKSRERAKGWENMPYWVKDNQQFTGKFEVNTYTKEEYTFTRARNIAIAMSRAMAEFQKQYPRIENTKLAAIHHYTQGGGNYRQLNKQLSKANLSDFNKAAASLISKGLADLPKVTGPVYRGTIIARKEYDAIYSGSEVIHKIFTSASQDIGTAVNFASYRTANKNEVQVIFTIHSKTGRNISDISEFNGTFANENQHEVLFDEGTQFVITNKETDKGGTVWIEMQEK